MGRGETPPPHPKPRTASKATRFIVLLGPGCDRGADRKIERDRQHPWIVVDNRSVRPLQTAAKTESSRLAGEDGPLFFPIPAAVQIHSYSFLDKPLPVKRGHVDDNRNQEVDIAKLEKRLLAAHPEIAEVEASFYPMSGTDSALLFQILPNLRISVCADYRPFWDSIPKDGELYQVKDRATAWREWSDIAEDGYLGPKIIGTLAESIPNFRLRSVTMFQTNEILGWSTDRSKATHGIVEFDQGPGTPVRQHVQLQVSMYNHTWEAAGWVKRALDRVDARFLLIKAANEHFYARAAEGVGEDLIERVKRHKGFILEGQHKSGLKSWELSGYSGRLPEAWEAAIRGVNFGYNGNVMLHGFVEPKRQRR
jgi:hypothetical protein